MLTILLQVALISSVAAGILPFVFKRWTAVAKFTSFALFGISGAAAVFVGISFLFARSAIHYQINSDFPDVVWQFKVDPLSGFFLFIVGIVVVSVAVYGPGYMRSYGKRNSTARMSFFSGLFIAGMYLVLLADDALTFVLSWELMSIASYFLVAHNHEHAANREAAFVYLLMAHASGLLILASYGVLIKFGHGISFVAMHAAHLSSLWSSIAFVLALLGFGMKAGIMPLHVWLPRAHPVAPSHISALMSGVMLKVAIYGLLRFIFNLSDAVHWQWGVLVLIIGTISALLGVLYALMQHDLKRLLAYHSVENIGIIFIGIGLAIIFLSTGHPVLAALGLVAALYHCLNHALFKSLLFLGAGAILQHSHEHDLEKMGGLIHRMPYTALFFLIGCISIAALPPFNGFVSEWLTFQTALQATILQSGILRTLIPVAAALLALTGALAAACFVKVYGIAFLGRARTRHVRHSRDPSFGMRVSMGFLAVLCLLFGILPTFTVNIINVIPEVLIGSKLFNPHNWLWLIPLSPTTASYNASVIAVSILAIWFVVYFALRLRYRKAQCRSVQPWECGFGGLTARMQYTATAFAMPIRRVFKGVWSVDEMVKKQDAEIKYDLHVDDWSWKYFYARLGHQASEVAHVVARIQGGNVRVYLAYTFFTLIILLWVVS